MPELIELVPRMAGCGLARLTESEYRQTRNPTLKGLTKAAAGVSSIFSALTVDTEPAMVPFLRRRSDHHHVVERLRIALQRDVAGNRRPVNREFERFVTDVLEGEGGPAETVIR